MVPLRTLPAAGCRLPASACQLGEIREPKWHVLWTRSHCEELVYEQLAAKGFSPFLPKMNVWARRNGLRHAGRVPMFPGYLFLHHMMDKAAYVEVSKTRGLVRLLGDGWEHLACVPDEEIEAIRAVLRSSLPVRAHAYLQEGERVRITQGLLAGVEGLLVRSKPQKGLLVVSIELLRRAIAVEIDCTLVVAA
jgi:transcription antitermination factor NusG